MPAIFPVTRVEIWAEARRLRPAGEPDPDGKGALRNAGPPSFVRQSRCCTAVDVAPARLTTSNLWIRE